MNRRVRLHLLEGAAAFAAGTHAGTTLDGDRLVVGADAGTRRLDGVPFEQAWWLSPELPGEDAEDLVPSWNARTPPGTWLELEVRWAPHGGRLGRWYSLGRWAEDDSTIRAASVVGQHDDRTRVDTDVLRPRGGARIGSFQLRVVLLRRLGSTASPTVSLVSAVVSAAGAGSVSGSGWGSGSGAERGPEVRAEHPAWGTVLDVPAYSQLRHRGAYPGYGEGGASWCSPTSTTMVLHAWGLGPGEEDYAWVDPSMPDRFVPHAARATYDAAYAGCGNWPFNTAYAATFGARAYVTRLATLRELEDLVGAGLPVVASVVFGEEDATTTGYTTDGHLLVVVGFDEEGRVVTNDPASHSQPSNDKVRTTFGRDRFSHAWLGRARGVVYLIHPPR